MWLRRGQGEACTSPHAALSSCHLTSCSYWSPTPPIPNSSALSSLHGIRSPSRDPDTVYTPHAFPILLQLHTTQKSQVFPLSLQLKGRPARFLDSPDPMTGWSPHPSTWLQGTQPPWVGSAVGGLLPVPTVQAQLPPLAIPNAHRLSMPALPSSTCSFNIYLFT